MMFSSSIVSIFLIFYFCVSLLLLFYTISDKCSSSDKVMIKCPDCGYKISKNAKKCPRCYSEVIQDKEIVEESIIINEEKSKYQKNKIFLIIYQLIAGIVIVIGFEKTDSLFSQILLLSSLIINTISLIMFNKRSTQIRKKLGYRISIISIAAIICGVIFSAIYTSLFINNMDMGSANDVKEIMYLDIYSKEEAKQFLNNIYTALQENEYSDGCLNLYGIWEDRNEEDTYTVNLKDTCESSYLPANSIKIKVDGVNKTEIDKIYWNFNDSTDIVLYEDGKQVDDFVYLYNALLYTKAPKYPIKDYFEEEVKEYLKSPSSAIFTYNSFSYSQKERRFYFDGWSESQNSFGAMVRTDFELKLIPCSKDYCDWYSLDYEWKFK